MESDSYGKFAAWYFREEKVVEHTFPFLVLALASILACPGQCPILNDKTGHAGAAVDPDRGDYFMVHFEP